MDEPREDDDLPDPAEQGREGTRDLPPSVTRDNPGDDDDAALVGSGDRSGR